VDSAFLRKETRTPRSPPCGKRLALRVEWGFVSSPVGKAAGDAPLYTDDILAQLRATSAVSPGVEQAASADSGAPRIAIYDDARTSPRVIVVPETRLPDVIDAIASRTYELARQQGGRFPYTVLREVIENLIHAYFTDVIVTILDHGNTVRISDHGPGIPDKDRALRPGFTTAGPELKRFIRGSGSGLPIVRESLAYIEGMLEIDDNLGSGTVVTLRLPPPPAAPVPPPPPTRSDAVLNDRQLKVLLLILELGPVGPTRVAAELKISPTTAYRDILVLETAQFVSSGPGGQRAVTPEGLRYLDQSF
jgi:hypothetical protein